MNKEELENFAREAVKGIKSKRDLSEFSQALTKAVKKRKSFPTDDSAKKVSFVIQEASGNWIMPIRNRKAALNRFVIEFEGWPIEYV